MGANASTLDREGRPTAPLPPSQPADPADPADPACPIDHSSREAWLKQARESGQTPPIPHPIPQSSPAKAPLLAGESCDSSTIDQSLPTRPTRSKAGLTTDRQISSIPRASDSPDVGRPANNEVESGKSKEGNWIYPSEQMFFDAMKRKNYNPQAPDMRSIVPIHNAVNERAWREILAWEQGRGSEKCGGPKLVSFSGNAKDLSPKARLNGLMGYQEPFDRHDWVVDRCGRRVEYLIDFYAGKDEGRVGKSLNFYLDVRPKLNTFEGWKMRAGRLVGF